MAQAEIGLIGLGVMGANLALNIAEKGNAIAVYNRTSEKTDAFMSEAGELADRITAAPGNKQYSFVSVYLQYHMEIDVVEKRIGPQNFFPSPDVDSSIVVLRRKGRSFGPEDMLFKDVVKKAFSSRRKRLAKNLQSLPLQIHGSEIESIVFELFQNSGIRAEELSVSDFTRLTKALMPFMLYS